MDTQDWQREVSGALGRIAGTLDAIKDTMERHDAAIDDLKAAHLETRLAVASTKSVLSMSAGCGAAVAAVVEFLRHFLGTQS